MSKFVIFIDIFFYSGMIALFISLVGDVFQKFISGQTVTIITYQEPEDPKLVIFKNSIYSVKAKRKAADYLAQSLVLQEPRLLILNFIYFDN